jgi:hypothetical protein
MVRDRTFDVVAFSSVLHHVPDMCAALSEGRGHSFDPNLHHPAIADLRAPAKPAAERAGLQRR